MKNLNFLPSSCRRLTTMEKRLWGKYPKSEAGAFTVMSNTDAKYLNVIATAGDGWDHVSVSRADRPPVWDEMEQIKHLFFKEDEVAYQFHVPTSDHINNHKNCLHIWRHQKEKVSLPPKEFV